MIVQKVAPEQTDIDFILSLDEAKRFIRVIDTEDDLDIQSFINSAIAEAQDITNRQFATATYELYLSEFKREIKLPKNPIQEILSIEYLDSSNNYITLDSNSYFLYEDLEIGTIVFRTIPGVRVEQKAVKITFKSGYVSDFPADLKQWLKVRVSTLYEYREELTAGVSISKNNHVDSILQRYRIRS